MASFAERSREAYIRQIQDKPQIGNDNVLSAVPLMRMNMIMLLVAGIVGALAVQTLLGFGSLQFPLGLAVGYVAYFAYVLGTMEQPRFLGAMGVLTDKRIILLGSRRVGVAGEWSLSHIEDVEQQRKGNLFIAGKILIKPIDGNPYRFFVSNPAMGTHFVEQYRQLRGS